MLSREISSKYTKKNIAREVSHDMNNTVSNLCTVIFAQITNVP